MILIQRNSINAPENSISLLAFLRNLVHPNRLPALLRSSPPRPPLPTGRLLAWALKSTGEAEFISAVISALQAGLSRYQASNGTGLIDDLASTLVNVISLVNMNEPLGSCGPFFAPPRRFSAEKEVPPLPPRSPR